MLRAFLFYVLLPKPRKWYQFFIGSGLYHIYNHWYSFTLKSTVAEWHRQGLKDLDSNFRLQEASIALAKARNEYYAGGGDPMDPNCPDLFDFLPEGTLNFDFGLKEGERN